MKTINRLWSVVLLSMCFASCITTVERSSLGLALGGGGAKGAAEVGVLMILDSAEVQVGYIAGSSMGAVVGGLYAAGYSSKEIRDLWLTEDWLTLFDKSAIGSAHKGGYNDVDRNIFGVVEGDDFERRLNETFEKKGVETFDDLRDKGIEFCCTATQLYDNGNLDTVVLSKGNLAQAIHASMAYPAPIVGIDPVVIDGKTLVDGGMLNNLPVDVVKKMGAKRVIAVDLEQKRKEEHNFIVKAGINFILGKFHKELRYTNTDWLLRWEKDRKDVYQHRVNFEAADVKVWPSLPNPYGVKSFGREHVEQMILIGKQAMLDQMSKVKDILEEEATSK